jgi:hypothetical protein
VIGVFALAWSRIRPDRDHFRATLAIKVWILVRANLVGGRRQSATHLVHTPSPRQGDIGLDVPLRADMVTITVCRPARSDLAV